MQPSIPEQYPNWRQVYGAIERTPGHPDAGNDDAEFLRHKLARLASLSLTSVQVYDHFVADLKAAVTKEARDPELQQLVEDYGALALGRFTQNSDLALRMAIERVIDDRQPVIVRNVTQPAPRHKSLTERILGR
jgi:hypothetical protein